ncbi:MAG: D-aminoacylase, partial [Gemmatimonadota bacterium]|nr:D-aminoacylase [Gemmatimonadota bacterium]
MILRAITLLTVIALAKPLSAQEQTVLISNGRVMDGSGNPWVRADVLIQGDKIIEIGDLGNTSADEVIDATGLYVTPGFIDTHSHSGPGLATE